VPIGVQERGEPWADVTMFHALSTNRTLNLSLIIQYSNIPHAFVGVMKSFEIVVMVAQYCDYN
jgi:hypothetical protein